jgi:hypothetical protein
MSRQIDPETNDQIIPNKFEWDHFKCNQLFKTIYEGRFYFTSDHTALIFHAVQCTDF